MRFRLMLKGRPALAGVAGEVVARLARAAGVDPGAASDLVETARGTCEHALSSGSPAGVTREAGPVRIEVDGDLGEVRLAGETSSEPACAG